MNKGFNMDEYNRLYKMYINKTDDELKKIIKDEKKYTKVAVKVAKDILQYERGQVDFQNVEEPRKNYKWVIGIFQKLGILILLVTIYPLGMFLLWRNEKFDRQFKIIESVSCLVLWVLLIAVVYNNNLKPEESELQVVENLEQNNEGLSGQIKGEDETLSITEEQSVMTIATDSTILEVDKTERKENEEIESTINEASSETEEIRNSGATSRKVSELTFDGESIIDVTIHDMKEYEYIKDVYIDINESEKQINIVVQIPSDTDEDTGRMAGEDVARYLASLASWSNESYSGPSSDDIGGIYKQYSLLIYVDDGNHTFDIYGAKVTTAKKITWR